MSAFDPKKLHVTLDNQLEAQCAPLPRCYTLTHSDRTGDLFLTIAPAFDLEQISGWYTRLTHDEVLGEWEDGNPSTLHIHCHVSGGLVLGPARWRARIFRQHLPMVLDAICYGDRRWIAGQSVLKDASIFIHFHAKQQSLEVVENWGPVKDHLPTIE